MNKLTILLILVIGCGGYSTGTAPAQPSNDTEVAGQVDTDEPTDTELTGCEGACQGFDFTSCMSVLMKSLPVGRGIHTEGCLSRCEELEEVYLDMPYDDVPFECLYTVMNCPAVAVCFEVEE